MSYKGWFSAMHLAGGGLCKSRAEGYSDAISQGTARCVWQKENPSDEATDGVKWERKSCGHPRLGSRTYLREACALQSSWV